MTNETVFNDQLLAVLVIYNVEITQSSTYLNLVKSLQHEGSKIDLLIYDNSLHDQEVATSELVTIHYKHDPTNGGVSKAYNAGCKLATELNKQWLLLLDQDDLFPETTIKSYREAIQTYPDIKIFAPIVHDEKSIISPYKMRLGGGSRINKIDPGVYKLSQYLLINSGLLICVSSFHEAGGYDENFSLDFSDLDFVIRLRNSVNHFAIIPVAYKHSLSINTNQSIESRLKRFRIYIKSAKLFRSKYHNASRSILLRSFFMSIKLSIRHRSIQFIKEYFTLLK